ncbi:hypothetical protein BDW62DRAFT_22226 [Aspergillus aurantiobrunneus]
MPLRCSTDLGTSFIPRTPGSGVPQDPGSSWNPPDQVDGSNYTHYSGLSHDRFSHQGYAPGHRGLSGHQSRPGRRHANTFPEHSAPTAQLSVTRTSHSGPSPNPQPGVSRALLRILFHVF